MKDILRAQASGARWLLSPIVPRWRRIPQDPASEKSLERNPSVSSIHKELPTLPYAHEHHLKLDQETPPRPNEAMGVMDITSKFQGTGFPDSPTLPPRTPRTPIVNSYTVWRQRYFGGEGEAPERDSRREDDVDMEEPTKTDQVLRRKPAPRMSDSSSLQRGGRGEHVNPNEPSSPASPYAVEGKEDEFGGDSRV